MFSIEHIEILKLSGRIVFGLRLGTVDVGHTVCPTFNQQLQCGNPAPHS